MPATRTKTRKEERTADAPDRRRGLQGTTVFLKPFEIRALKSTAASLGISTSEFVRRATAAYAEARV